MSEAKKKRRSFAIVIMMAIMAVALCMALISCGGNETDPAETESKVKTEQSADAEEKVDAADESDLQKEDDAVKNENATSNKSSKDSAKKETLKQTTAATTQAKQVCYITIENYCSGKEITLQGGDTVYSILCRSGAAVSGSGSYVKGINGLFEFDEGPTSGWVYYVNGSKPSVGCGSCSVKAGDSIKWDYVKGY